MGTHPNLCLSEGQPEMRKWENREWRDEAGLSWITKEPLLLSFPQLLKKIRKSIAKERERESYDVITLNESIVIGWLR